MTDLKIRAARAEEAGALTALCKRSKAHWGYDADFMRLSDAALTIAPDFIAQGGVLAAEDASGRLLGVASIAPMEEGGVFDLVHLFIEPDFIKSGLGRALFDAAATLARARAGRILTILADPNAAGFYRRMGARDLGDAPSDSIPGRTLPLLAYDL
jgi:GNAT superfamily N-acetyltransferase